MWSAVIVVSAAIFALLVPQLPDRFPAERDTVPGEVLPVGIGSIAAPAGWSLDTAAASSGTPVMTRGEVTITAYDGVWFGASEGLVSKLRDRIANQGYEVSEVYVDPDAKGETREVHPFSFRSDDYAGQLFVIREEIGIVVVRAEGPADALAEAGDVVREVVDSASTGVQLDDAPPSDPGLGLAREAQGLRLILRGAAR